MVGPPLPAVRSQPRTANAPVAPRPLLPEPVTDLPETWSYRVKRLLLGPPLDTAQLVHERLGKPTAGSGRYGSSRGAGCRRSSARSSTRVAGSRWSSMAAATSLGATAAVSAALAFEFFHTRPYLHVRIASGDDLETTVLLRVVGLVVGHVTANGRRARRSADASYRETKRLDREVELGALSPPPAHARREHSA